MSGPLVPILPGSESSFDAILKNDCPNTN
jgi:hypothetical protein